jgi:trehalose 6-phosphate phosphatase
MVQPAAPAPSLDWCLFLDVDGTLIELTDTPFHTKASEELKTLLACAADRLGGALALVSGRRIEYLDALFAPLRLPAAGLHGAERRSAAGLMHGAGSLANDPRLDPARGALATFVATHPGTLLEDKGSTLAVHYRLAPHFDSAVRESVAAALTPLGQSHELQPGSMMLEIKPRGFTKGTAITAFLREPPFCARTPVFVGDDLTDLDGFRAVEAAGGLTIAVGDRVTGSHRLDDPAAVRSWLAQFAAAAA